MDVTGRTLRLDRNEDAPAAARSWIEKAVSGLPEEIGADVTLLTHELVTNAVRHAEGETLWIAALLGPDAIRVEVSDQGGTTEPRVAPQEPFATGGRGLLWVERLADSWGTDRNRAHYVWFQIDLESGRLSKGEPGSTRDDEISPAER